MAAGQYNFTIEQGATLIKQFTYKDSAGAVVDLTGYTCSMQIRDNISSDTTIDDLNNISLGGLSILPTTGSSVSGTIQLNIHANSSSLYVFDQAVYDLEIKSAEIVTRLLQGRIKLSKEVTR
tara:strand:- start:1022 stop:1387 length:366 start_codon:yes stop_codon:yes gene_type:complete